MARQKKNTQRQPNGQFAKGNKEGNRFSSINQPDPKKISEAIQKKNAEQRETEKTIDILSRILQKLVKDKQGQELTAKEAMLLSLLQKALKGDIRAIELIVKLLGEMPTEKQEIKTTIEGIPTTINILPVKVKNDD